MSTTDVAPDVIELDHPRAFWHPVYERMVAFRARRALRRRGGRPAARVVAGLTLEVEAGVFDPVLCRTGLYLAEGLRRDPPSPGARVLDLGTGTGVGALAAAAATGDARAVAVDLDPRAVACARANARANGLDGRVEVREGDLFAPVAGERFDLVISNPPFFAGEPRSRSDLAFRGGDVARRLAAGLSEHLAPGGRLRLVLSSLGEVAPFVDALRAHGFEVRLRDRRRLVNETLGLLEASRGDERPGPGGEAR